MLFGLPYTTIGKKLNKNKIVETPGFTFTNKLIKNYVYKEKTVSTIKQMEIWKKIYLIKEQQLRAK